MYILIFDYLCKNFVARPKSKPSNTSNFFELLEVRTVTGIGRRKVSNIEGAHIYFDPRSAENIEGVQTSIPTPCLGQGHRNV